ANNAITAKPDAAIRDRFIWTSKVRTGALRCWRAGPQGRLQIAGRVTTTGHRAAGATAPQRRLRNPAAYFVLAVSRDGPGRQIGMRPDLTQNTIGCLDPSKLGMGSKTTSEETVVALTLGERVL